MKKVLAWLLAGIVAMGAAFSLARFWQRGRPQGSHSVATRDSDGVDASLETIREFAKSSSIEAFNREFDEIAQGVSPASRSAAILSAANAVSTEVVDKMAWSVVNELPIERQPGRNMIENLSEETMNSEGILRMRRKANQVIALIAPLRERFKDSNSPYTQFPDRKRLFAANAVRTVCDRVGDVKVETVSHEYSIPIFSAREVRVLNAIIESVDSGEGERLGIPKRIVPQFVDEVQSHRMPRISKGCLKEMVKLIDREQKSLEQHCEEDQAEIRRLQSDYERIGDFFRILADEVSLRTQQSCKPASTEVLDLEAMIRLTDSNPDIVTPGIQLPRRRCEHDVRRVPEGRA